MYGYSSPWMAKAPATKDGLAHYLEHLAGYLGVGLVHHAGVAFGVAVHEPLLLFDVPEGFAQPPHPP
jgi:hypothetical protein